MNNFQRIGAVSNAHAGKDFEEKAYNYFLNLGLNVKKEYSVKLGFSKKKKHRFDLGGVNNNHQEFVVECKSHTWTATENVPTAKLTVWNEVMLYFSLLPPETEKILFVLKHYSKTRDKTLAQYYVCTYGHLIPRGTEIIEYDDNSNQANTVYKNKEEICT